MLSISEILEKASVLSKKEDKIHFLKENDSVSLRGVLKFALEPGINWLLPRGTPPYKPCEYLDQHNQLHLKAPKLMMFVQGGGYDDLRQNKREILFIQFLESLDPKDAQLIIAAKDKTIPYKGLSLDIINAAYPGLINENIIKEQLVIERGKSIIPEIKEENHIENVQSIKTNPKRGRPNKTGYTGVSWRKDKKRFVAQKYFNGKLHRVGSFRTAEEANEAIQKFLRENNIISNG